MIGAIFFVSDKNVIMIQDNKRFVAVIMYSKFLTPQQKFDRCNGQ